MKDVEIKTSPHVTDLKAHRRAERHYCWFKKFGRSSFPVTWEGWLVWIAGCLALILSIEILRHAQTNLLLALIGWTIPFLSVYVVAKITITKSS